MKQVAHMNSKQQHTTPAQESAVFCTINEAARRSGISAFAIRKAARAGEIPLVKFGRIFRINYPAFIAQLSEQSRGAAE